MSKYYLTLIPAKLSDLNFQPLEVVSRYRDSQPQVVENYSYVTHLYITSLMLDKYNMELMVPLDSTQLELLI